MKALFDHSACVMPFRLLNAQKVNKMLIEGGNPEKVDKIFIKGDQKKSTKHSSMVIPKKVNKTFIKGKKRSTKNVLKFFDFFVLSALVYLYSAYQEKKANFKPCHSISGDR